MYVFHLRMVEDFGGGGEGIKAYDIAVKILWRLGHRKDTMVLELKTSRS